jgi:hypothetical protein
MVDRITPRAYGRGPAAFAGEDPEAVSAIMGKLKAASLQDKMRRMAMTPEGEVYDATTPDGKAYKERIMQERSFMTPTSLSAGSQWGGFEQYAGDRNRMLRAIGEREVDPYEQLVGPRDAAGVGRPGGMSENASALQMNMDPRNPGRAQQFLGGLRRAAGTNYGV